MFLRDRFLSFLSIFASILYYITFIAVAFRGILFGFYIIVPGIRRFIINNRFLSFFIGDKVLKETENKDISYGVIFKYFLLPYAFSVAAVIILHTFVFGFLSS